jgi:hypothetical protein
MKRAALLAAWRASRRGLPDLQLRRTRLHDQRLLVLAVLSPSDLSSSLVEQQHFTWPWSRKTSWDGAAGCLLPCVASPASLDNRPLLALILVGCFCLQVDTGLLVPLQQSGTCDLPDVRGAACSLVFEFE